MRTERLSLTTCSRFAVAGGMAIAVAACNAPLGVRPPTDHDAEGSWVEDFGGVAPGSSLLLTMTESSGVVTGSGTSTGEAIAPSSVAVMGTVANQVLDLSIVFTADSSFAPGARPDTTHFVGVLSSRDRIDGTLTRSNGSSSTLRLIRRVLSSANDGSFRRGDVSGVPLRGSH